MTSFQRILFPVDFSEESRRTAPFVKAFADRFHADVTLLHIFELPLMIAGLVDCPTYLDATCIDEARAVRQAELDSFLPDGFAGVKVCRQIADGDPAIQIVSYASEKNVDLIMIPTHGYGRFRRLLLGSVAAKVLHDADCAVWTSVHRAEPMVHPPDGCKRILCAVDTQPGDIDVIRWAAKFGDEQNAEVQLVHAIVGGNADQFDSAAFNNFLLQFAGEELGKMQAQAGTALKVQLPLGNPAEAIHSVALDHNADLIVIGRGVLKKAFGGLRSNAYSIIRESPCPVISI